MPTLALGARTSALLCSTLAFAPIAVALLSATSVPGAASWPRYVSSEPDPVLGRRGAAGRVTHRGVAGARRCVSQCVEACCGVVVAGGGVQGAGAERRVLAPGDIARQRTRARRGVVRARGVQVEREPAVGCVVARGCVGPQREQARAGVQAARGRAEQRLVADGGVRVPGRVLVQCEGTGRCVPAAPCRGGNKCGGSDRGVVRAGRTRRQRSEPDRGVDVPVVFTTSAEYPSPVLLDPVVLLASASAPTAVPLLAVVFRFRAK